MPLFLFGVESERDNLIICAHLKGNAMTTLSKRLCLTALLALSSFAFAASATAETSKLIIESGDSAQSRQNAAMDKEQWNDTRSLRQKVNSGTKKMSLSTRAISVSKVPTLTPTGSQIPCAAWIVVLAARSRHNVSAV